RHVRRAFEAEYGITPVAYLQTCRLLLAKSLLTDSGLPMASVAAAAGFGSVRRMSALFRERYRMAPSDLRKRSKAAPGEVTVGLGCRPPYRFEELLELFRVRALAGVELVGEDPYSRTARIALPDGSRVEGRVRVADGPKRNALALTVSESLLPALPHIAARVRRQFDTDCDPQAIRDGVAQLDQVVPGAAVLGTRLPGCFEPFETACRAVLGQQISVAAANKLAARIVERFGAPVQTGIEGLTRLPRARRYPGARTRRGRVRRARRHQDALAGYPAHRGIGHERRPRPLAGRRHRRADGRPARDQGRRPLDRELHRHARPGAHRRVPRDRRGR
ncbi:MAG: helix-turn-helix domain-containing protein, partial [Eggerthellaceae bacterium]|nr:helix-turn-helix domain-containing protein [Eggerthellaceae bacterium]